MLFTADAWPGIADGSITLTFRTWQRAQAKAGGRRMAAANRKPHIDKVFEILKALPDMAVFANEQELDEYLDAMQARTRGQ